MDTFSKVRQMISEISGTAEKDIKLSSSFTDDLHMDSLELVELAVSIEDGFSIKVPYEKMDMFTTVGDAVSYIETACARN
ncbi:hypothetical protein BFT35_01825 [Thermoanaerobacterium thermosaccharolyticum]|jgi:Phosphopantetheine attachment site.|uniref:Acyl carrier protein n=2 Tax=Clostridia TaxID=186801 RepID=A0A078KMR2_9FIRM|nr:acyl carrier protein [Thermoanaerobacterium thermosaccharolyticum]AST58397.1 acyl carrier protein [Thermoanaerobacterium thermosaccharolyticum]PHO08224.1 hypothetical protein BFT35_01825 [Thermoanaerobacterium thermosaccharolyticum]PZM89328.1 MAG: acyl carrier protein [[Clostridium] cellulosi]CDZ25051.1 hypothetical protein CCDG5_1959 [[Clostridium] cellulosi]